MSKSGNSAQSKGLKAIARIRNVGVIAHIDAGKTTLTERMLFYSGRIHRMGEVHEGAATMDFMPEEQERGITIAAACESWDWQGCRVNLIDTPGHVDFTIEVERSLRVLDGAVGVFCGVGGVEPQSETVWRQSEKRKVPKLAFVNKMDRPGANFESVLTQMREILGARPVAVTFPVLEDDELIGVVDCLRMRSLTFDPASEGATVDCLELSPELARQAAPWREKLVEAVCETDDGLLETYLAGGELSAERLTQALRAATLAGRLTPAFAGSALKNVGVQPLMDAICAFLPSPLDVGPAEGAAPEKKAVVLLPPDENAPLGALVFKILVDEGARRLAVARIYSGRISEGQAVWNATRSPREGEERVSRLFALHAGRKERVESAGPGEIVALAGLKSARTGDSLSGKDRPVVLESIDDYRPVISLAIEPRSATETERLTEALEKYLLEDPTLTMSHDEATGQVILSGMGELHLEVVLQRLRRESGLDPRVGRPQVVSRETISSEAEGTGEFDRLLGDAPHYGYVRVAVAPRERGAGSEVALGLDPEHLPRALVEAALEGVADGLHGGVTGNPVEDVSARVIEIRLRPGASSPAGQRMAGAFALKDALAAAGPRLLEPLMRLEIVVPQDHVGDVIGLVSAKGGRVENLYDPIGRSGAKVVSALAPLRDLFGFSTELRSATQGRAGLTMRFERFDAV